MCYREGCIMHIREGAKESLAFSRHLVSILSTNNQTTIIASYVNVPQLWMFVRSLEQS